MAKDSSQKRGFSFLTKSQQKIGDLRRKLQNLSDKKKVSMDPEPIPKIDTSSTKEVKVVISVLSVIKATVAIFLLMALVNVLGTIKSVIILFLAALFLSAAFNPAVDRLETYKFPRSLSIILIYILVMGVFVVMFSSLVPIIADQIGQLAQSAKEMIQNLMTGKNSDSWIVEKLQPYANQLWQNVDQAKVISSVSETLTDIAKNLTGYADNAIGVIFSVFNGIFNLIMVLVITFLMVVNTKENGEFFQSLFPHRYSGYITHKFRQIHTIMGEWIRGQLLLALAMGTLTFIVFSIIGINYALTLALISAVGEFIPFLGPIITFVSALLIAFNQDPVLVIWLVAAYGVLQFVEGNILVPLIVGRAVGLNPIAVIFALLCGASIGGTIGGSFGLALMGMIIAIPVANIIGLFLQDYVAKNKMRTK